MHRSRHALRTCSRAFSTGQAAPAPAGASYQAPLKPGQLAAFDYALAYIQQDREAKLASLEQLKKDGADQATLEKVEVEAWSNDPEVRWRAKNGQGAYTLPAVCCISSCHEWPRASAPLFERGGDVPSWMAAASKR